MIVRRPGTWRTMSGEGTDDDSSNKGIGMSGLQEQQQQVKTVESSRPGSSGSSGSSSNSEWGSCSELLLVSAVKKHGVPKWNLVASELKARAILLNIPPSWFTEEACKFKYNVLKGKFASSSSSGGGGSVSSPEDDLAGGVTWFEELRKLRMSHLKEELQVYDSSIGQLQSRISKLQEERAHCLSPQSVMKHQCDSNCKADNYPHGCKSLDMRPSIPTCPSEEFLEMSQDTALTNAADADPRVENLRITTDDLDQQKSSIMEVDAHENKEDNPGTSTTQLTGLDPTDEVLEKGSDVISKQSIPLVSQSPEKVAENGEDQVGQAISNVVQVGDDEIVKEESDPEMSASNSDQAIVEDQAAVEDYSVVVDKIILVDHGEVEDPVALGDQAIVDEAAETTSGEVGDVHVCGDGVDAAAADLAMPKNEATAVLDEKAQGKDSEPDIAVSTSYPSPSTSTAVDNAEELPTRDYPDEAVGVVIGPSSLGRAPEPEATNTRGNLKVGSISKRESRLSRLSLSYGRAEKEKRLKAKEEAKLKEMSRPEIPEVEDHQLSERTLEKDNVLGVEGKDNKDTSVPIEQTENGRSSPCHPSPTVEVDEGSVKQDVVVPDSPTSAIRDGRDNGVDCTGLCTGNSPRNPVGADVHPSAIDVDVLQPGFDVLLSKGAEPSSPEDEMPLLTVSLGPDPELAEPRPSVVSTEVERLKDEVTTPLESSPNSEIEVVSQERNLKEAAAVQVVGMPNEVKFSTSSMTPQQTDGKSEEVPEEVHNLMMESETIEVRPGEMAKVAEVGDMVIEGNEGETLEADPSVSRSVGEDMPETLDAKGSEEESRDGPETGEAQQPFAEYTDSQIDKSEVGSSMDSIEDMSPSSRKNRREPKVPGKFLPLLECLRVICAHKFAPLFRQRQEYQDNARYDRLVRRHVDLSMVRARLEEGAYSGSVEFFRDLLLIFTNALVYSSSDSQEYVGAKALRSCALTEMDKILQTEALLRQNGPATRKREVRKSMEVHKARVSSHSTGSEVRKKGILKSNNETPAALDSQGGAKSAHIAFEDTPHAGRSSSHNEVDRDLDARIETTFKKAAATRVVKEETPRKELQRPEYLNESGHRGPGGTSGKKMKVNRDAQKTSLQGQILADLRASGGRLNVESIGKKTPAKMKDVICIDLEKKGTPNNSSSVVSSGLPVEKQRTTPIARQISTSRVSRYSKRGGESTASNPKKRVRK